MKSRVLIPALAALLLLPACHQAPPAPSATSIAQGATLMVKPSFSRRIAEVGLHSRASIGHVVIEVLRIEGGSEVPTAQATVSAGELDQAIQFQNLRYNTTYKLRARAYHLDGPLISDDAASTATVVIGSAAPAIAALQVQLVNRPYPTVSTLAAVSSPAGVAVGGDGAVYVAQPTNGRVVKIVGSTVTTLAEGLAYPYGLAVDDHGTVYVADADAHSILTITQVGGVQVLAGSGQNGAANGTGMDASFSYPYGLAVDGQGHVYVADSHNHRIRKITPQGVVTTLAGSGAIAHADGTGVDAAFNYPSGVAVDARGQVYVADTSNHRIRKVSPEGVVTTLAGSGTAAFADGVGAGASFDGLMDVTVDRLGNVFAADRSNHRIRKVSPDGVVTTIAGSSQAAYVDGNGYLARFSVPGSLAVGSGDRLYVSDEMNNQIRVIE